MADGEDEQDPLPQRTLAAWGQGVCEGVDGHVHHGSELGRARPGSAQDGERLVHGRRVDGEGLGVLGTGGRTRSR